MKKLLIDSTVQGEIIDSYNLGKNIYRLSLKFGYSKSTISRMLKRLGILRSQSQAKFRYICDDLVFEHLNPVSEYWLGFLLADGCIYCNPSNNFKIQLSLQAEDLDHIQKFKDFLKTDARIYKDIRSLCDVQTGKLNHYIQYKIIVTSNPLATSLFRYGITPRKSFTAKVENDLLLKSSHFWRGLIDGDGCVRFTKPHGKCHSLPSIELCGTENVCFNFSEFVREMVKDHRIKVKKYSKIYSIKFCGFKLAFPIIEKLYSNVPVSLNRKQLIADKIIKYNILEPAPIEQNKIVEKKDG
jgi:hypothetical protein